MQNTRTMTALELPCVVCLHHAPCMMHTYMRRGGSNIKRKMRWDVESNSCSVSRVTSGDYPSQKFLSLSACVDSASGRVASQSDAERSRMGPHASTRAALTHRCARERLAQTSTSGSVKKTLLRRRGHVGHLVRKTSNQGLDCSCCCCVARQRLAQKECFFLRHQ